MFGQDDEQYAGESGALLRLGWTLGEPWIGQMGRNLCLGSGLNRASHSSSSFGVVGVVCVVTGGVLVIVAIVLDSWPPPCACSALS